MFCAQCGERRVGDREFGVRHFLGQALAGMTTLDGRVLGSIRRLLLQPGELTDRWRRGARVGILRPIQLFVLVNLVVVLVADWAGVQSWASSSSAEAVEPWIERMQAQAEALQMTQDQYRRLYDEKAASIARATVGLLIPFAALLSVLLCWRADRRIGVHCAVATNLVAYLLLVPDLLMSGVLSPILRSSIASRELAVNLALLIPALALGWWWFAATRRLFGLSAWAALWRAILTTFLLLVVGLLAHQWLIFHLTLRALAT